MLSSKLAHLHSFLGLHTKLWYIHSVSSPEVSGHPGFLGTLPVSLQQLYHHLFSYSEFVPCTRLNSHYTQIIDSIQTLQSAQHTELFKLTELFPAALQDRTELCGLGHGSASRRGTNYQKVRTAVWLVLLLHLKQQINKSYVCKTSIYFCPLCILYNSLVATHLQLPFGLMATTNEPLELGMDKDLHFNI